MKTASAGIQTRLLAATVVEQVIFQGRSLKTVLAHSLSEISDSRDRSLVEALCFAVLRQHYRYRNTLNKWLKKPLAAQYSMVECLLWIGFAQLDSLKLPAHAALSATVEAVKFGGFTHHASLVNALLRRAQREGIAHFPAEQAWPHALRQRIKNDWKTQADTIFTQSAQQAPLWLRVNQQKISRELYQQQLTDAGITTTIHPEFPDALRLDTSTAITALPGFLDGYFSVQDISAQAVVELFSLYIEKNPTARVLDACAAPGGKTAHLLERAPQLQLFAMDNQAKRLPNLENNLTRLGLKAQIQHADITELDSWWDGVPFDAILLDAPCSATGVVRRQPDILFHRNNADISSLCEIQTALLDATWKTLAVGGILVYATCSLFKCENQQQIADFLQRHSNAELDVIPVREGQNSNNGVQQFPDPSGGDGFFYARLRKLA